MFLKALRRVKVDTKRLTSRAGTPLHFGVQVNVSGYDEAMAIPKEQLDDWVYNDKLLIIKGMPQLTKPQFWELSTRFGGGAWARRDYIVGWEECTSVGDGTDRVYAHYSNSGSTARAIGDVEMSWHVDIPLWPTHKAPLRSFHAVSIPDNNYGITSFADRAWGYATMTESEQQEAAQWELLYQSWYRPGTSLTWLPVVAESPHDSAKYLQFTSFNNSFKKYSHNWHGWKIHGWVLGARQNGVPHNADYVSFLHEKTIQPANVFDLRWDENDFAIWNNVHMIHSRSALRSNLHTKPREFYRMNIFNKWQNENYRTTGQNS